MNRDPDRELTAQLAEAAGLRLHEDRLEVVSEAVVALLELADTLEDLPLEGVEPAPRRPEWS